MLDEIQNSAVDSTSAVQAEGAGSSPAAESPLSGKMGWPLPYVGLHISTVLLFG